jgi:hypothetical protein
MSMVYSLKFTFVTNDNNLTDDGLTPDETICFGSLEFTIDRFGKLNLSPTSTICVNSLEFVSSTISDE